MTSTSESTGDETDADTETGADSGMSSCENDELFACREDASGECRAESGCVAGGQCNPLTCWRESGALDFEVCDDLCGEWWDCVPSASPDTLQCAPSDEFCDLLDDQCPDGFKCTPWSADGGKGWDAWRCVPIAPEPVDVGAPCEVADYPGSGLDDCPDASACWNQGWSGVQGICVSVCGGDYEDLSCPPGYQCYVNGSGVSFFCLAECDPLGQDCDDGYGCGPYNETFFCEADYSGDGGFYGDPCDYSSNCKSGLYCLSQEHIEGCQGLRCCSPYCDVSLPNTCPGATQECIPWYENSPPEGYEDLGVCGVP